jgi:CRP-like cAMP-binding protein
MATEFEPLPTRSFTRGDVVFRQGDAAGGHAYLVHEGTLQVTRREGDQERVLRTLKKGDLLGEVALFRDAPHSATAVALDAVVLLVIPANRLEQLVRTHPALAIALIRQLARMAAGDASASGAEPSPP